MPSLKVLSTNMSMVMKEGLSDARVSVKGHAVVERCKVLTVSVVGRGPELQHGPHGLNVVCPNSPNE